MLEVSEILSWDWKLDVGPDSSNRLGRRKEFSDGRF